MGETSEIGIAELLSVLARRGHSGRLAIMSDGEEVQLFLTDGKIILVTSSNHGLRLGRVLVRLGILDQARLDAAVREQDRGGGRPLGQILLHAGFVTAEQLERAAEEQCIEALTRVIVAGHGTFTFSRDTLPVTKAGLVTLNTDGIVLEASRRADEMMTLRSLLPAPSAKLTLVRPAIAGAEGVTGLEETVVRALAIGPATLAELAERLTVEQASLWRTVIRLRERGIIAARDDREDEPEPVAPVPERAVEEIVALCGESPISARPVPTLAEVRAGTPASSQTIAAITVVVREAIAAFNAGLNLRAFASFTDDHFRRQGPLPEDEIELLGRPPSPLRAEEQETFIGIRDVRLLSDGRVSAILHTHVPTVGETRKVLVFVRGEERWQIDAVIEAPNPARVASTTLMMRPAGGTSLLSAQAIPAR